MRESSEEVALQLEILKQTGSFLGEWRDLINYVHRPSRKGSLISLFTALFGYNFRFSQRIPMHPHTFPCSSQVLTLHSRAAYPKLHLLSLADLCHRELLYLISSTTFLNCLKHEASLVLGMHFLNTRIFSVNAGCDRIREMDIDTLLLQSG